MLRSEHQPISPFALRANTAVVAWRSQSDLLSWGDNQGSPGPWLGSGPGGKVTCSRPILLHVVQNPVVRMVGLNFN